MSLWRWEVGRPPKKLRPHVLEYAPVATAFSRAWLAAAEHSGLSLDDHLADEPEAIDD